MMHYPTEGPRSRLISHGTPPPRTVAAICCPMWDRHCLVPRTARPGARSSSAGAHRPWRDLIVGEVFVEAAQAGFRQIDDIPDGDGVVVPRHQKPNKRLLQRG